MVKTNLEYLDVLADYFNGKNITINDYKLARKEAYSSFANLAASFQRMISEPASKQKNIDAVQRFIILNQQLSSLIGSNAAAVFTGKLELFRKTASNLKDINQSADILRETLDQINKAQQLNAPIPSKLHSTHADLANGIVVKSQLKLILGKCNDIRRTAGEIFNSVW